MSAREQIEQLLRDNPEGLSRTQITRGVDANPGVVRQMLAKLIVSGEVVAEEVEGPHGYTVVNRLAD